jgi:hypothetical protein
MAGDYYCALLPGGLDPVGRSQQSDEPQITRKVVWVVQTVDVFNDTFR